MVARINSIWLDYVRVFATFCVVLLHSAAPLLDKYGKLNDVDWWAGNLYDSLARISVPLFFMVSGALLLGKDEGVRVFVKKRFEKVFLPLVVWSFIYLFWRVFFEASAQLSFYSLYSMVLTPVYYHLWFLYAIIGLYLFVPILRVIVCHAPESYLKYYVALWFLAAALIPLSEWLTGLSSRIDLRGVSGMSGYLVVGYLFSRRLVSVGVMRGAVVLFVTSTFFAAIVTYFLTVKNDGKFVGYFYGYLTPNVILASCSAFVVIKYAVTRFDFFRHPAVLAAVSSLSSTSFGVYLIHAMYLYLLAEGRLGVDILDLDLGEIFTVPLTVILVFAVSHLSVLILRKIPIVARIVP